MRDSKRYGDGKKFLLGSTSHVRRAAWPVLLAVVALSAPATLFAQQTTTMTLRQAVDIALVKNPERKAALAETKAASADVQGAKSFLLPRATFSESATLGNDPVYVFGTKLRQQRFTASDFTLAVLNTPKAIGNFESHFGATWNIFDSLGSWRGVRRAEYVKDAVQHQLERKEQEIVFHVVESYYGVLLARKDLEVAEQAMKTAQAVLDRSKNRFESGVVVESDYLSAQVRFATRKQELIRAQNDLALGRAQLSTSMGVSAGVEYEPAETLAERELPKTSLEEIESRALELRPDLKRIHSEESAQEQSASIAKSAFGPRVNAFANWQADNPTLLSGGGGTNWVAGFELQFDLFQGGAKRAQLAHEHAAQETVKAEEEMTANAIRLEVRRAFYDLDTCRQLSEVAHATIAESQESLRINQNRYESGLSTITDLLAAEEAVRRSQADYWEAMYRYYTGYARLELAGGILNPHSPVVTP